MKIYNTKNACCGCGACASSCLKKCISMREDEEGFLYPEVDTTTCVNCGKCVKVCPEKKLTVGKNLKENFPTAYVAYVKNTCMRKMSSSGGVFMLIAEKVIELGGVVFGAAFSNDFKEVCHIGVEDRKDLFKLQGSKYTQSNIGECYILAKSFLDKKRIVLFSGTACQIEGLKSFLGRDYQNLYTIDVLCHGVPSPKLWRKYVKEKEIEYGARVRRVNFRNKSSGWNNYSFEMCFENNACLKQMHTQNIYMDMFLKNICLRPSCYRCIFKNIRRESDFSLGDCWGVENHTPEMFDDLGTSVIMVHTIKGMGMMQSLENEMFSTEKAVDVVLPSDSDSRRSVREHPNRKKFFKELAEEKDINQLSKLVRLTFLQKCIRKVRIYVERTSSPFLCFPAKSRQR